MFKKEIFKKGPLRGAFVGTMITLMIVPTIILGGKGYANVAEHNAINDCKTNGYNKMVASQTIDPQEITKEQVAVNCTTLKGRIDNILSEYGVEKGAFDVYITDSSNDIAGDGANARVISLYNVNENIRPIMNISYQADYEYTLRSTIAHELVHVYTSNKEREELAKNPLFWKDAYNPEALDPSEAAADCGSSYFTKEEFKGGAYKFECSPEQTEIAVSVIKDTLIK